MFRTLRSVSKVVVPNRSMGSIIFENFGAPATVLKANTASSGSAPKKGEVRVTVKSSDVTVDDLNAITGYAILSNKAGVAGSFAVGTVSSVGDGVKSHAANDNVVVVGNGVWADNVSVPASNAFKIPVLSTDESAGFSSVVSAVSILNKFPGSKAGDVVLVVNGAKGLGPAISQVGSSLGLKVVSFSEAEANDAGFIDKIKASGPVKYAVTGRSGKYIRNIFKVLQNSGTVVVYNGANESLSESEAVDVPMSAAIFNDLRIVGFNLKVEASQNPAAFGKSVAAAAELIANKKVSLKTKSYAWTEFVAATNDTKTTGLATSLKF